MEKPRVTYFEIRLFYLQLLEFNTIQITLLSKQLLGVVIPENIFDISHQPFNGVADNSKKTGITICKVTCKEKMCAMFWN